VGNLKANTYNPNIQSEADFDLLIRSITEDGFTQPIVARESTHEIVDGEHRWRAARKMGMKAVPVVFVNMSDEQMRISTLRHNRARGSEDVDLGAKVLRDLRELGALDWAQDSLKLDDLELQRLLEDVSAADGLAGEEYSESWAPQLTSERSERNDYERGSMSDEAQKLTEALSERLKRASSNGERAKLETQMREAVFRISIIFTDAEAEEVRSVLEPKPAQELLALCASYLEGRE